MAKLITLAVALVTLSAVILLTEAEHKKPPFYIPRFTMCRKEEKVECDKRNSENIMEQKKAYLNRMDQWIGNQPDDKKATWRKDFPKHAKQYDGIKEQIHG